MTKKITYYVGNLSEDRKRWKRHPKGEWLEYVAQYWWDRAQKGQAHLCQKRFNRQWRWEYFALVPDDFQGGPTFDKRGVH